MFAQVRLAGSSSSFAPAWSTLRLTSVLHAVLGLCLSLQVCAGHAAAFHIEDAHSWRDDGNYLLDAQFSIDLSPGAQEALDNGIPLVLVLQVQIVKTHKWFWDVVASESSQRRLLEYHALSRSYLVKNLNAGTQGNYHRLEEALRAAGTLQDLLLTDQTLEQSRDYKIRLRGSLDIEALPTPVRLLAYVSSAWEMESEWYAWPLVR